jgi:hypothetical protein
MTDMTFHSLQKMGGEALHHYCWALHLKVYASPYINLFRWFYIFNMHLQGLRFKIWQIHRFIHWVGGKLWTIVIELFTWEFLQVSTSSCINSFKWILYFRAFNFQHIWCCLIIFAISYKFLHQFTHMQLSTLMLFENLALTSFHCYC